MSDRCDHGREDGVQAACDVAHGPSCEDGGVAEEMRGHCCSLLLVRRGLAVLAALIGVAVLVVFAGVADDR